MVGSGSDPPQMASVRSIRDEKFLEHPAGGDQCGFELLLVGDGVFDAGERARPCCAIPTDDEQLDAAAVLVPAHDDAFRCAFEDPGLRAGEHPSEISVYQPRRSRQADWKASRRVQFWEAKRATATNGRARAIGPTTRASDRAIWRVRLSDKSHVAPQLNRGMAIRGIVVADLASRQSRGCRLLSSAPLGPESASTGCRAWPAPLRRSSVQRP
jgi:hypothetical protein